MARALNLNTVVWIAIICVGVLITLFPFSRAYALTTAQETALINGICPNGSTVLERDIIQWVSCKNSDGSVSLQAKPLYLYNDVLTRLGIAAGEVPSRIAIDQPVAGHTDSNWFYDWVWEPLLVQISAGLMSLAGMILTIAGSLFDLLIQYVIIGFGQTLKTFGLDISINMIWAVFRDIANILIIGMFVFIAIATILSIESYGVRKWIVRLLLVAVFLNFSMFLTQLTIDTSNYVAYQLYQGLDLSRHSPSTEQELQIGGVNLIADTGIASTFVTQIGLSGVWGATVEKLDAMAKENIWVMFGYALTASILLIAVGLILLYGCFLIATRAILLLFLLLTSSVAVASILLPGDLAKQGWGKWKESLINAAVFAPLIMVFLFMVITILEGAHGREGALGLKDYLDNPTNGNAWDAILIFIFATGLLYASFKFAGDFAKKIGGFAGAASLPALGATLAAGVGGWTLRNTAGRGASRLADIQQKRAQQLTAEGRHTEAAVARMSGQALGGIGKRSFNFMNTAAGKQVAGLAGGEKGLIGGALKKASAAGKGGFAQQEKDTVKKQQEVAKYLAPSKEQQEAVRRSAMSQASTEELENMRTVLRMEDAHKSEQTALKEAHKTAIANKETQIKQTAARAIADPAAQAELQTQITEMEALRKTHSDEMAAANTKVTVASTRAQAVKLRVMPKESFQSNEQNVADIAHRRAGNIPWRMLTGQTTEQDSIAKQVRESVKKERDDKEYKARVKKFLPPEEEPPAAPTVPPAGTP